MVGQSCEAFMLHSFCCILTTAVHCISERKIIHFASKMRRAGWKAVSYPCTIARLKGRECVKPSFSAQTVDFLWCVAVFQTCCAPPRGMRERGNRRREKQRVGISSAGRGEHCKYSVFSGYGLLFPAKWYIVIHNSKIVPFCPFFGNEQKFRAQCVKITTPGEGMPQSRSERGKVSERD